MSAVTADYDECTCIGGRCMRKEQSYASAFFYILARNCEDTEQLPYIFKLSKNVVIEPLTVTESV